MINNKECIKKITMKPTAVTKCRIGQDWYKHELEITMEPSEVYPDYMLIEKWIMEDIDGKDMNIEEVVDVIYEKVSNDFQPKSLHVKDYIYGNKVHFDVVVEK